MTKKEISNARKVVKAASELCIQLRKVHKDAAYKEVWCVAQNHRGHYAGLKYIYELCALEEALAKMDVAKNQD